MYTASGRLEHKESPDVTEIMHTFRYKFPHLIVQKWNGNFMELYCYSTIISVNGNFVLVKNHRD